MPSGSQPPPGPRARRIAATFDTERRRQGMSQTDLAARIGVSQNYLSALLGGRRVLTSDQVQNIADALGLDADEVWTNATPGS